MALTRKMLRAMGIEDEKVEQIIEAHTESTDALKADRDKYKEQLDALGDVQKELDKAVKNAEKLQKDLDAATPYKEKYETEHKDFEDFKKGVEADKTKAKKSEAYKALLKKAGVSDKRFDAIVKVTSMDDIELDDNGEVKNADKLVESIKTDWSEFIVTKTTQGAPTETPPANTGGKMSKEDIMKIKDRNERQKAIDENHELFGY